MSYSMNICARHLYAITVVLGPLQFFSSLCYMGISKHYDIVANMNYFTIYGKKVLSCHLQLSCQYFTVHLHSSYKGNNLMYSINSKILF